ncbi:MAG: NifB/NifX family molybdenum-iron cluster-binding protein [Clostridia bacterium]
MKIAVTYENGEVFQHFGHAKQFKVYTVENGRVVSAEIMDTDGSGHSGNVDFLKGVGADKLICGGIGGGARAGVTLAGIVLCSGVQGDADGAVDALLTNRLAFSNEATCDHHHEHGHHEHTCGESCRH